MLTNPDFSALDIFCGGALCASQDQAVAAELGVVYIFEVHYVYNFLHQLFARSLSARLEYDVVYAEWPILYHKFLFLSSDVFLYFEAVVVVYLSRCCFTFCLFV